LKVVITTVTTDHAAPVILGQRLRKGACGSPRGPARMVCDTPATVRRLRCTESMGRASTGRVLLPPGMTAALRNLLAGWD
jgi:hypothetical protein